MICYMIAVICPVSDGN